MKTITNAEKVSWNIAEYVTAFAALDWLFSLKHGIKGYSIVVSVITENAQYKVKGIICVLTFCERKQVVEDLSMARNGSYDNITLELCVKLQLEKE